MMTPDMDERHRKEVAEAYVATRHLRVAARLSALLGLAGLGWEIGAMVAGSQGVSQGIVVVVALALATLVPAAGLYAASFRTSLGAARLERLLERA